MSLSLPNDDLATVAMFDGFKFFTKGEPFTCFYLFEPRALVSAFDFSLLLSGLSLLSLGGLSLLEGPSFLPAGISSRCLLLSTSGQTPTFEDLTLSLFSSLFFDTKGELPEPFSFLVPCRSFSKFVSRRHWVVSACNWSIPVVRRVHFLETVGNLLTWLVALHVWISSLVW